MATNKSGSFPHNGNLLMSAVREAKIPISELSRQMHVHPTSFYQYVKSDSLQMRVWWNLSLTLERNLIAELGERLPVDYETKKEKELKKKLEDVKKELETLKIQLEVYKSIIEK
ncbi:MAG TPA: hypothetical protein DDZ96_00170 [Porphyromonadaceae bacterium]|jgi:hypothetical protein|nr:hypothetical protein [Porphyromonadaceae bacterium]HBL32218.1 hypothetical protein [Porphyromonadaceae bacterium]HCM20905.1 hypothetical protein [Porphyromonadaceae bacterium]